MEPFHRRRVGWAEEEFERFSGIELSAGCRRDKMAAQSENWQSSNKAAQLHNGDNRGRCTRVGSLIGVAVAFNW